MLKKLKYTCVIALGIAPVFDLRAQEAPPPAAPAQDSALKKVVGSLFGFSDAPPPAPAPAPAPEPQVIEKIVYVPAPGSEEAPPPPIDDMPPPLPDDLIPQDSDFSKISDPALRSCALQFQTDLKGCSNNNCQYEAQNKLKGCIRPVIARRLLKQFASLFDEADIYFAKQPLFRSCVDKFSEFVVSCKGSKGCGEVLYYSLHNGCGKRLYNVGFVAGRSAALENNVFSAGSSSPTNNSSPASAPAPTEAAPLPPEASTEVPPA